MADYRPILLAKRAELWALSELGEERTGAVAPLIAVANPEPPADRAVRHRAWTPSGALSHRLTHERDGVLGCLGGKNPIRLDLSRVSHEGFDRADHPAKWAFDLCSDVGLPALPVTGPSLPRDYRDVAAQAARNFGRGACIRAVGDDLASGTTGLAVVLRELDLPRDTIDLVIDLGALLTDRTALMSDLAMRWIEGFQPVSSWRSVSVVGGAFPATLSDQVEHEAQAVIPRRDYQLWNALRARTGLRLEYGDYGPVAPVAPPGRRGAANLRYATPSDWLVLRGQRPDDTDSAEYAHLAHVLMCQRSIWRQKEHCTGCAYIERHAASGYGGNSTTWRQADFAHHFATVLEDIPM